MCQWVSGQAQYVDECEVLVHTLPCTDSHEAVKASAGLRDEGAPLDRHAPVEYYPTRGLRDIDQYVFGLDDVAPSWWT